MIQLTVIGALTAHELHDVRALMSGQHDMTIDRWDEEYESREVFAAERARRFLGVCSFTAGLYTVQPYIWVRPDERRKGVGTEIARALAVELISRGVRQLNPGIVDESAPFGRGAVRLALQLKFLVEQRTTFE